MTILPKQKQWNQENQIEEEGKEEKKIHKHNEVTNRNGINTIDTEH